MSSSILVVSHVSKSFGQKRILKEISIDLHQGEILGLIGASGSGKTTLLKTIIGFHKPDVGDVQFKISSLFSKSKSNTDFVSLYDQHEFAKNIFGFASQEPSFYENLTVRENLAYFGSLYGLSEKDLESNINILISLMDLNHAQNVFAGKLSGGMQRRLDIACAMVHDPDVLILDEPTADLDPVLRMHMWNVIRKINKKGTTILIASHHLAEVEEFCSRIAILKDGVLIDLNTPSRIKASHAETEKITVQSYPGNYAQILFSLKERFGLELSSKITHSGLLLSSNHTKDILHVLLDVLDNNDEMLIDIHVSKPSLDELFQKITKTDAAIHTNTNIDINKHVRKEF